VWLWSGCNGRRALPGTSRTADPLAAAGTRSGARKILLLPAVARGRCCGRRRNRQLRKKVDFEIVADETCV